MKWEYEGGGNLSIFGSVETFIANKESFQTRITNRRFSQPL
jgi:hypothetical protein